MKKNKYTKWILSAACAVLLGSCVDENMNINPNTSPNLDPNLQISTIQVMPGNSAQDQWRYFVFPGGFMNQWGGDWSVINYGGSATLSDGHSSQLWSHLYTYVIKDVVDLVDRTNGIDEYKNINAAARILKVENFLKLTDYYGDIPYFEAGKAAQGTFKPKYDTQKDIYKDFLKELDEAVKQFDASKPSLTGDLYYGGDINKWKRYGNSLRLRIAMRLINVTDSDIDVKKEIEDAANAGGGLMNSNNDICFVKYDNVSDVERSAGNGIANLLYMANPSTFKVTKELIGTMQENSDPRIRFYAGSFLNDADRTKRTDITDELLAAYDAAYPGNNTPYRRFCLPAQRYTWDAWDWAQGEDAMQNPITITTKAGIVVSVDRDLQFMQASTYINNPAAPQIRMSYAEVELLLADAKLRGYNVSTLTAAQHFENALRASVSQWTIFDALVTETMIQDFVDANPLDSDNQTALEQVNTQLWVLHFLDPIEAWSNWRRTGMPAEQTKFKNAQPAQNDSEGKTPRRMPYPIAEQTANPEGYQSAIQRMGGNDSWLNRVWWDQKTLLP